MRLHIFQDPFDENKFKEFLETFIPQLTFATSRNEVRTGFDFIKQIGEARNSNLDLVVFIAKPKASINARIDITKNTYTFLKTHARSNALVAYISEDSSEWRLSLVTTTVTRTKEGVKETVSDPRRYSYVLGPSAKVVTPRRQLSGSISDLGELKKRFSLEVVNKEFFTQIASLYTRLVGGERDRKNYKPELKVQGQSPEQLANFAIRLIGRLVFCWFLKQKKSVAGLPLISDALLGTEAVSQNQAYYHTICAPLFFEVLNKQIEHRPESLLHKTRFDGVPYLNGGLFSPQYEDHYRFDTTMEISELGVVSVPDSWLTDFFGLLEMYNFTIDENILNDTELSVDPEMLGRIFENLLAEVNPETGDSARKATGSFYTPREIVGYMVDESIIAHVQHSTGIDVTKIRALCSFDTDDDAQHSLSVGEKKKIVDSLCEITVLDPACGSGAFPIGVLQKIVYMLGVVDPNCNLYLEQQLKGASAEFRRAINTNRREHNLNYVRKLGVLRESIFGIDIQPIAVEISRLRCFLTLVVDQHVDDAKPNKGIDSLPNLEFKFVCANTLVPLPKPAQGSIFNDSEGVEKLKDLRDEYFSSTNSEKAQLKFKFVETQKQMFAHMVKMRGRDELAHALSSWEPFSDGSSPWFDPEWMFGINDFDVVIGNPPYLRIQGLQKTQADMVPLYKKEYESAHGSFDLYALFIERGYKLLGKKGHLVYIVPHKFFQATFGKKLRQLIASKKALSQIVKFGAEQVFENPTTYTCLLFLSIQPKENFRYTDVTIMDNLTETMSAIASRREIAGVVIGILPAPTGDEWSFQAGEAGGVLKTLNKQRQKLGDVVEKIFQGIATSADKIYALKVVEEKSDSFRLFSPALEEEVEIEKGLVRPFLMGKDVHRYQVPALRNSVIFPYHDVDGKMVLMEQKYIQENFPKGWDYLLRNREALEGRENGRMKSERFYAYIYPKNLNLYHLPKIMTPEIALGGQMTFDGRGVAHTTKVYSFVFKLGLEEDIKYWLGLLNSKVLWFFLSNTGYVLRGGYFTFKTNYLTPFPVKRIDFENRAEKTSHDEIVRLVDLTLKKKKADSQADTSEYEADIDKLVCELYGLSPEEIEIVENPSK